MFSELENYRQRIEDLRDQVSALVAGLPAEALNWRPLAGSGDQATNSLAVLATHVAGAERFWIAEVVGGRPSTRDRDAEFTVQASAADELLSLLARTGDESRPILAALSPGDLEVEREARGRVIPVRWCILHVIDHTALHLGHMQLTYQLWAGGGGKPSPYWFERLPSKE